MNRFAADFLTRAKSDIRFTLFPIIIPEKSTKKIAENGEVIDSLLFLINIADK